MLTVHQRLVLRDDEADHRQGKGYPDLSTRTFLHRLSTAHHPGEAPLPIFALVDFDPDGIHIMSTYKHGSPAYSHEHSTTAVSSICWLGVKPVDLCHHSRTSDTAGLLPLTAHDHKKAISMLKSNLFDETEGESEWRTAIQTMLLLDIKVEIQLLSARPGGLTEWLDHRLAVSLRFIGDRLTTV